MKFKGFNPALTQPAPIPETVILSTSRLTDVDIERQVRLNEAADALTEHVLDPGIDPETREMTQESVDEAMHDDNRKLSRLIDDDFPFDPSQIGAVEGMIQQTAACLIGRAGTGKTTVTKKLVDRLLESVTTEVDMSTYFKRKYVSPDADEDDSYEAPPEKYVPSVCMVTFTGKASQMIKKNFPSDWHPNIMTIHRALAYAPEIYSDFDDSLGEMVEKFRFSPQYTAKNKMPWDIIVMDESGMTSIDLWLELYAAMKPGCRIYMVGDINQLPPVHGRSIFGFAMTQWPTYELTTIHRQAGVNNSIVDNAWLVLQGKTPKSDGPVGMNWISKEGMIESLNYIVTQPDWKSLLIEIPAEPLTASRRIRQALKLLQDKFYDPIRDTVITAINGHDGSQGRVLGQIPMNMELSVSLNQNPDRYIIDAGRERKNFAVGDKVMATVNDHDIGVTNGMTGIITEIGEHAGYAGDKQRYGRVEDVSDYLNDVEHEEVEFSLDDVADSMVAQQNAKSSEGRGRGPASHIVTVQFGEDEYAIVVPFSTQATVASLMQAYVVTGHKMQGGESPHVMTIVHHSHKQMLYREWLYTCWTRASEKAILLYTPFALRNALNKQRIKGRTLEEKITSFQKLQDQGAASALKVDLPESKKVDGVIQTNNALVVQGLRDRGSPTILPSPPKEILILDDTGESKNVAIQLRNNDLKPIFDGVIGGKMVDMKTAPKPIVIERVIERVVIVEWEAPKVSRESVLSALMEKLARERSEKFYAERTQAQPPADIDGGTLTPEKPMTYTQDHVRLERKPLLLEDRREIDYTPYNPNRWDIVNPNSMDQPTPKPIPLQLEKPKFKFGGIKNA